MHKKRAYVCCSTEETSNRDSISPFFNFTASEKHLKKIVAQVVKKFAEKYNEGDNIYKQAQWK